MPFFFIHCAEERSVKYFCQNVELNDKTHILTVGPGKNFQEKNWLPRSNGFNSKTKRDIVKGKNDRYVYSNKRPVVENLVT